MSVYAPVDLPLGGPINKPNLGECTTTLTGHTGGVTSVAFDPTDPTRLATGSCDETAKIWNTETGECTKTLNGHIRYVNSVAFHSTNPTYLATASSDKTTKIWNTETGECLKTFTGHSSRLNSVAYHPTDPTRLATASSDKTARLWSVGSKLRRRLESEFGAAHPIVVKTLAGYTYTLEDWGLCKDLKAAVCKLAPKTLGKPATFELLGNLSDLGNCGEGGGTVQIDGKYGSDDRRRMMVKGCGFNFELALVYSAAAAGGDRV